MVSRSEFRGRGKGKECGVSGTTGCVGGGGGKEGVGCVGCANDTVAAEADEEE